MLRCLPSDLCDSQWLAKAIESSLSKSKLTAAEIDLVYGHGRGLPKQDQLELAAIRQVFGDKKPSVSSVIGNTGVAAATSGLYSVAAAALGIRHGEIYPVVGTSGDLAQQVDLVTDVRSQSLRNVLVAGSTENGNHHAIVLRAPEVN